MGCTVRSTASRWSSRDTTWGALTRQPRTHRSTRHWFMAESMQAMRESVDPQNANLPDGAALIGGLTVALESQSPGQGSITVLARTIDEYYSTYPKEIVTCAIGGGPAVRLMCKYSSDVDHAAFGHRHGLRHEAAVYR